MNLADRASFTPGPWAAQCDKPKSKNPMALIITPGGRAAIDATNSGSSYAEDCANARLVAAAPELYANTEHMLDRLEQILAYLRAGNTHMASAKVLADISRIKAMLGEAP